MPKNGPFPSKEADLDNYFQTAQPYLVANAARLGISADNINVLTSNFNAWNTAFPPSQNPDTRTKSVTDSKNIANQNMQNTLRAIYADIPESALTVQDRNTLNLPERSKSHTPSPVPDTKPIAKVDTSKHLEHTIAFTDEATPASTAKPDGVRGCQIWMKIGSPAADVSELQYVATDTNSPYVNHFTVANAGKPVYYWLRWENTRGETGPWSDQVMATITA
jgi:hypothetical protein